MTIPITHDGLAFTLLTSAARTSSDTGSAVFTGARVRYGVLLSISDASLHENTDTLDVYVDVSPDGGTSWMNAIHFTQRAGNASGAAAEWAVLDPSAGAATVTATTSNAASGAVRPYLFGNAMRARWVIADSGDADSTHTFGIKVYAI